MNEQTPFFICGYPRSRTAWLANLFTTDTTLCFHEPHEAVEDLIAQHPQYRIGVSSCMLVREFFAVAKQYPKAPWLFVDRNKEQCRESMLAFANTRLLGDEYDALIRTHFAAAQIIKDDARTMVVAYDDLDKHLPAVWNHLLPDVVFNATRAQLLIELKVEQRLEPALNRITNGRQQLWQH